MGKVCIQYYLVCVLCSTGTHTFLNSVDDDDDDDGDDDDGDDESPLVILCRVCEGSNSHFFYSTLQTLQQTHFFCNN